MAFYIVWDYKFATDWTFDAYKKKLLNQVYLYTSLGKILLL